MQLPVAAMDLTKQLRVRPFESAERRDCSTTSASPSATSENALLVLHLYDRLHARVLKYALAIGIPLQDAEDIAQETFISLFLHLELDRPRSNLAGWLFRVTHNLALKRRASNQAVARVLVSDRSLDRYSSKYNSAESDLVFSEQQRRLRAIWEVLPEIDRHCLFLRAEGMKYREIAKIVGISLGSVAASLSKSMARMARITEGG